MPTSSGHVYVSVFFSNLRRLMPLVLIAIFLVLVGSLAPASAERVQPPQDGTRIEAAIDDLIGRMTLEDKVGQLNFESLDFPRDKQLESVRAGRVGSMLNVVDPQFIRETTQAAASSRLKIPMIFAIDAIYAFRITFTPPLAWAATWRPELAEAAAEAVARETAANGVNLTFAPMVDISRDARWGRVIEGAGEDPFLGAAFAAARVRGYRRGGLATSAKHFVGYGAPEGGRDYAGTQLSDAELFDRYLPPFVAALEAGTDTVMASFNTVNGVPVTAERRLVTDLLKTRLGFDGIVMSDFAAVTELVAHGVAADYSEAARKAMHAGIDLDMQGKAYGSHLADEVRAGRVSMEAIDAAVRRVLRVKHRMGLFERKVAELKPDGPGTAPDEQATRAVARQVARESFVLLKNDDEALPIGRDVRAIALIGAAADSTAVDHSWYGPAQLSQPKTQTLREALEERLKPGQQLRYAPGFADTCGTRFGDKEGALAAARRADLVVLVLAEDCVVSGEGVSRSDLNLGAVQQEMLESLVEIGRPVVLVLETGRPITLNYAQKHAVAILLAWHPGTEGRTALAEILTGEVAPSGKLPMTFPRSVGQIPISYDQLPTGRPWNGHRYTSGYLDVENSPLYPFGFGLGYTTFKYSDLKVSRSRMGRSGRLGVTVTVENTGKRSGSETVQLYVRQLVASRSRPVRLLKGFRKVELAPGTKKTVKFELAASDLAFHDNEGRAVVEPGSFHVFVGGSSTADLMARFEIAGE